MTEETKSPIVITPFMATVLAAFVTLTVSGAGYIVSELRATHAQTREAKRGTLEAVEKIRAEAKRERDRYREEILRAIDDVRRASSQLEGRMFSKREHELYDQSVTQARQTLKAKIASLEGTLNRHLDSTELQGLAQ